MKNTAFILAIIVTFLVSCKKLDIEKGTPKCVEIKIKDFNDNSPCNDSRVDKYLFQNNTVYIFEPGTCGDDMTSGVIDFDCNELGTLGGIVGNTKINGEDFSNARFIKTIWKK
ncbi:MAG: hypothetical protein A2033_19110 [Bacteroidetes bacterium GWA2_31_9]|nr:MAG: hypothetical protein A2033_19110 [Bacteroidetes bacterium GWA2_31_9]